jgi:hypothetical protein
MRNYGLKAFGKKEDVLEGGGSLKSPFKIGSLGEHTKVGSICFLPLCVLLGKPSWKERGTSNPASSLRVSSKGSCLGGGFGHLLGSLGLLLGLSLSSLGALLAPLGLRFGALGVFWGST